MFGQRLRAVHELILTIVRVCGTTKRARPRIHFHLEECWLFCAVVLPESSHCFALASAAETALPAPALH